MLRKLVVATPATGGVLWCAAAVKRNDVPTSDVSEKSQYKCKPSDLPLYAPLHATNSQSKSCEPPKQSETLETLESGVRAVRTQVQSGYHSVTQQLQALDEYVETAKAHTAATLDYLNEPHNVLPRSGAVAMGGLAGFIFAARGGFIKKVLYTTIGAGAIASLCYPRQAEEAAHRALFEGRKGFAIAYNFVKGVKPGDEVTAEPINKFPTNLEELKFLMWDLYDEAMDTLFRSKKKGGSDQ